MVPAENQSCETDGPIWAQCASLSSPGSQHCNLVLLRLNHELNEYILMGMEGLLSEAFDMDSGETRS